MSRFDIDPNLMLNFYPWGQVEMEDEAVVQTVQRGLRSRLYSRGRCSPTREQGVHHFHRLVAEFMELDTARNAN